MPGFDALATQAIVPKHIWEKIDDPVKYMNPNPVGTGPFTEVLRFDNQIWELGRNNNYWQKDKPYIKKLTFPTFPSNEQVTLALNSGKLDWAGAFIPAVERVFVEKNPEMINIHPVFYLKGTNYLLEALVLIKHPSKFKITLNRLISNIESDDFRRNQNTSSLSFLYKYNNLFNLYALEGNFEDSLNIIPNVLDGIEENNDLIDPTHIMLLYYKIACMYFALDDYEKCIVYLDKIIKDKNLKMREDLQCFTRVLNLMAHYEAGYDYHLEKIIRNTYKYLLKMNDLHEVQKALIRYVRNLENIYPHDIKDSLKKLYKELKKFENDPYEKRSFLYLDILSYLESKIERKPLRDIIKEKAISLNRKEKQSINHS